MDDDRVQEGVERWMAPERLDRRTVPRLRNDLFQRFRQKVPKLLVVDLSDVSHMDTVGVALLVELFGQVKRRGGSVRLDGASENVRRVIKLARLSDFFFDGKVRGGQ